MDKIVTVYVQCTGLTDKLYRKNENMNIIVSGNSVKGKQNYIFTS